MWLVQLWLVQQVQQMLANRLPMQQLLLQVQRLNCYLQEQKRLGHLLLLLVLLAALLAWMLMQQQHQLRMQQRMQQRHLLAPLRAWTGLLPLLNSSSSNSPWFRSSSLCLSSSSKQAPVPSSNKNQLPRLLLVLLTHL